MVDRTLHLAELAADVDLTLGSAIGLSRHVQFAALQTHLLCHKAHLLHMQVFTTLQIFSAVGFPDTRRSQC